MNGVQQLEALNPVPELRGNPGPWREDIEPARRPARARVALAIAAAAIALVALGSFALRAGSDSTGDLQVATQIDDGNGDPDEGAASSEVVASSDDDVESTKESESSIDAIFGDADWQVAQLVIPSIRLFAPVTEGVEPADLRAGPGHYPDTPFPGQAGNAAVAGLRTTYGALFFRVDELVEGDTIFVSTVQGEFEYRVTENKIVEIDNTNILEDFGDNRLTLTTGHPRYANTQRLVIVAELLDEPAPSVSIADVLAELEAPAKKSAQLADNAPDIGDLAFGQGREPYYSYFGSPNALQSAWGFVGTQFPEWNHENLSLALHEQTGQAASVRWFDIEHGTAGWITLAFGDGQFWVFDMTIDGVTITMIGTHGSVSSENPIWMDVSAPVQVTTPGRPMPNTGPVGLEPLAVVRPKETADGLTANFQLDGPSQDYREVRYVLRNDNGDQIGGAAMSLLPSRPGVSLITRVEQLGELTELLGESSFVRRWTVTDRFQSVEELAMTAPGLLPETIEELPGYSSVRVIFDTRPGVLPEDYQAFADELTDRFDQRSEGDVELTAEAAGIYHLGPGSRYVVNELPEVARCIAWPDASEPSVTVNEVSQAAATAEEAIRVRPLVLEGPVTTFVNDAGQVLGFAQTARGRPWTFVKVIAVQQVDDGWVATQWQNAAC